MPKDEFDFDDPMELNGCALRTDEDTTAAMAECFIEEFSRLGYNAKQILALFRNPHYLGMNMVLQNRGEPFVRECISEVFARWGRTVVWQTSEANGTTQPTPALSAASLPSPHPMGRGQGEGAVNSGLVPEEGSFVKPAAHPNPLPIGWGEGEET